jgi:hypothetical protein
MNEATLTRKRPASKCVIGVDLDNTLVCYDGLFHSAGNEEALIDSTAPKSKERIRDAIRLLPDGERKWTRLQAIVYGPRMSRATAFPGSQHFLRNCARHGIAAVIVSHKTAFATLDGKQVDLRRAALDWMEAQNLFGPGAGLSPQQVFFESTREEKIARIRALGCTHFIDDLMEVFAEPGFPREVAKLLFAPHGAGERGEGIEVFQSWAELNQFFFDGE